MLSLKFNPAAGLMNRLHSTQSGQGPLLVILHGLFGNVDNFRSVAQHLESSFSIMRIDLPGHGQSPRLPLLSIEAMADAVLAELDGAGVSDFHLLGHSLGGKVAMCMAGNPACKGLEKLVIVDIAPKDYPPHHQHILAALQSVDLSALSDRRQADSLLHEQISDAGVRTFLLKSLYRQDSGEWGWRFDLQQLIRDYPLIARSPVIENRIQQPTLFIKGGNSDYLEATDEPLITQLFEQPSLKVITGAGHWPHAEKPAQFNRICHNFLDVAQQ